MVLGVPGQFSQFWYQQTKSLAELRIGKTVEDELQLDRPIGHREFLPASVP
jgi:hypothetical protein